MSASHGEPQTFSNPVVRWIEYRLPVFSTSKAFLVDYPAPRNLNYWWNFGSLAGIALVLQILTGVVLAMHYTPNAELAFKSVEHIMRDVNYGWLLRYAHANGASMFFAVVYIHIFRGLYYGSYKAPRELLWMLGVVILLADDGDGVHGLRAAVGADELLGGHGDHQPVLGDPAGRRGHRHLAVGRLHGRQPDAATGSTRCTTCCRSSSSPW